MRAPILDLEMIKNDAIVARFHAPDAGLARARRLSQGQSSFSRFHGSETAYPNNQVGDDIINCTL